MTLFERKLDNAKPCGGAIPVCMIDEFKLPMEIIDRKVLFVFLNHFLFLDSFYEGSQNETYLPLES